MAGVESYNPFSEDENEITENTEYISTPEQYTIENSQIVPSEITLDAVAAKLLNENFILTALELHTELVESRREIPRFRDYFSNPSHFEKIKTDTLSPGLLYRTSSVQTFDSLEFARFSDDGEKLVDERVAVLEFELRKCQDTIKALRASLTKEAENEVPAPDNWQSEQNGNDLSDDHIRPLEKRAINYLVNEYLLTHNYKLTSVTFCEENDDQDFEEWDEVGLNIPKPPDLLRLYRDYGNHIVTRLPCRDQTSQADIEDVALRNLRQTCTHLENSVNNLNHQLKNLQAENIQLQAQNRTLQVIQNINIRNDLYSDRSGSDPQNDLQVPDRDQTARSPQTISDDTSESNFCDNPVNDAPVTCRYSSPFDSIDNSSSLNDTSHTLSDSRHKSTGQDSESVIDDNGICEQPLDHHHRNMSPSFRQVLTDLCFYGNNTTNRIVAEVSQMSECDIHQVMEMLARCLPHIVPNVLLAKREELIPLIVCAATLHPNAKERDHLLNILFNLIKKPDEEQRKMILNGCVAFASYAGPAQVEAELLPQCWEQIGHKYDERRILVAEACAALAPYVPEAMRSSLVMSMLQQMIQEERNSVIRQSVIRSLAVLLSYITDCHKFNQGAELLMLALNDQSEAVIKTTQETLLPCLALWAAELGRLEHDLINMILRRLEHLSAAAVQKSIGSTNFPLDEIRFSNLVNSLRELLPFLFLGVLESGPYKDKLDQEMDESSTLDSTRFPKTESALTNISVIVGDTSRLAALVRLYEEHMNEEWINQWDAFSWVVNNLIPRCIEIIGSIGLSAPNVITTLSQFFSTLCQIFGHSFSDKKIKSRFKVILNIPEEELDGNVLLGQTALTTSTVPVYSSGVLSAFNTEDDRRELCQFLKTALCTLALCQAPLDSVKAAFVQLGLNSVNHEILLSVLWDGVMHTSKDVRIASSSLFELLIKGLGEAQISSRVVPALLTLANDPEISVRISTVPGFGSLLENVSSREILDRMYMQLQTFLDDAVYRDHHILHLELIRMFTKTAPNAEPKFRDECVLPRLAAMARENNTCTNETRRHDIATQLFEAYTSLSCCYVSQQMVTEVLLPGLRCLKTDMIQIAPEHVDVLQSMIKDYENKLDLSKMNYSTISDISVPVVSAGIHHHEDMKSRVISKLKDNTSGFFSWKK